MTRRWPSSKRPEPPTRSPTSEASYATRLSAGAGRVTFVFTKPAALGHNFAVRCGKRRLGITPTISRGATRRLTLRLTAARYTFYCVVPGHEASGMKGMLVIAR